MNCVIYCVLFLLVCSGAIGSGAFLIGLTIAGVLFCIAMGLLERYEPDNDDEKEDK